MRNMIDEDMNFDDMTNRIIDKIDKMDEKIDKLCQWKTKMEVQWNTHMEELDRKSQQKEKRFYYIIALMGVGFTVQEIIRSFL